MRPRLMLGNQKLLEKRLLALPIQISATAGLKFIPKMPSFLRFENELYKVVHRLNPVSEFKL